MIVSIIVAMGADRSIGRNNALMWTLRDDLRLFREITVGHAVILGRKSFEAIGQPLPNRRNIVISRKRHFSPEGVEVVSSVKDALALFQNSQEEIFILGGGEIYRQTIEHAHLLYITHVAADFPDADTHFPDWHPERWKSIEERDFPAGERNEFPFRFVKYERR